MAVLTDPEGPPEVVEIPDLEVDCSDAEVAARCPYCERPFAAERLRDLHVGEVHAGRWTDEERAAYREARDAEEDDLFLFHMKVVVALGLLYSTSVLGYTALVGLTG